MITAKVLANLKRKTFIEIHSHIPWSVEQAGFQQVSPGRIQK
jgi:hypothetical protein